MRKLTSTGRVYIGAAFQSTLTPREAIAVEIHRPRFDRPDRIVLAFSVAALLALVLLFVFGWLPGGGA